MSNAAKIGSANLIRSLTKERQEKEARGERIPEVPFTNADKIGAAALIRKLAMERASREQQEQAAQAAVRAELKRQREAERAAQKAERLRAAQERLTVAKQRLADVRAERAQQKTAKAAARERARAEQTAQATAKRAEFARASKSEPGLILAKEPKKRRNCLQSGSRQSKKKKTNCGWKKNGGKSRRTCRLMRSGCGIESCDGSEGAEIARGNCSGAGEGEIKRHDATG